MPAIAVTTSEIAPASTIEPLTSPVNEQQHQRGERKYEPPYRREDEGAERRESRRRRTRSLPRGSSRTGRHWHLGAAGVVLRSSRRGTPRFPVSDRCRAGMPGTSGLRWERGLAPVPAGRPPPAASSWRQRVPDLLVVDELRQQPAEDHHERTEHDGGSALSVAGATAGQVRGEMSVTVARAGVRRLRSRSVVLTGSL